jgi:hypothetical protein
MKWKICTIDKLKWMISCLIYFRFLILNGSDSLLDETAKINYLF